MNALLRKIRRLLGRALIRRVKYANKIRYFQIQQQGGTALDGVEHFEPFGFTSHPLPNAEAVVLAFNGNGSHSVAIVAGDQRYRLVIDEGEAAIYNSEGDKVHIKKDRSISVEAAVKVELVTPHTHMTGKLTVAESIKADGWVESGDYMKAAANVEAGADVLAAANMTAVGVVMGASLTNTAGTGSMSGSGVMTVKGLDATDDVTASGISLSGHTHIDSQGGSTGGAQ